MKHAFLAAISIATVMGMAGPAAAEIVHFNSGLYFLSHTNLGAPVDTLAVSVSGGLAHFTLGGADSAAFTVPDASTPTSTIFGLNPVYDIASSGILATWDTTTFPYLTFFLTSSEGGFAAGAPGGLGSNFVDLFQAVEGTGQVFTLTDTPEPMTLALFGAGLAGAAAFGRRRKLARVP